MYLKLLGAVLIVLGGSILGVYIGISPRLRQKELEQFKTIALIIQSEISYGNATIKEISKKLCINTQGDIREFFNTFNFVINNNSFESIQEVWISCVNKKLTDTHLSLEDIEIISTFGNSFSSFNKDTQLKAVDRMVSYINTQCTYLETLGRNKLRFCKTMGLLAGCLGVILLF